MAHVYVCVPGERVCLLYTSICHICMNTYIYVPNDPREESLNFHCVCYTSHIHIFSYIYIAHAAPHVYLRFITTTMGYIVRADIYSAATAKSLASLGGCCAGEERNYTRLQITLQEASYILCMHRKASSSLLRDSTRELT